MFNFNLHKSCDLIKQMNLCFIEDMIIDSPSWLISYMCAYEFDAMYLMGGEL